MTYPSATRARRGGAARAGRAAAARDRLPVPLARAAPRQAQPPALRARDAARRRRACAASTPAQLAAQVEANAARVFALAVNAPRQVTLARLAELGLRPDKRARPALPRRRQPARRDRAAGGARAAATSRSRSARASARSRRTWPASARTCTPSRSTAASRPALTRTLEGLRNVTVHWGDAMRIGLDGFEPAATAFVANLPYHVAAPLAARLDRRPAAACGAGACSCSARSPSGSRRRPERALYGAPSVLCALALEPTGRHAVSRSVFVPVPNVDSTLVAFARSAGVGRARRRLARASSRPCARPSRTAARRSPTRSRWPAGARTAAAVDAACRARRRRSGRARRGAAGRGVRAAGAGGGLTWSPASRSTSACASGRGAPTATTSWRRVLAALPRGRLAASSSPPRRRASRRRGSPGGDTLVTRGARPAGGARRPRGGLARAHRQARAGRRRARRRERRCRRRAAPRERDAARAARCGRAGRARGARSARTSRSSPRGWTPRSRAAAASCSSRCALRAPAWVVVAWPGVPLEHGRGLRALPAAGRRTGARRGAAGRAVRGCRLPAAGGTRRERPRPARRGSSARPSRRCARSCSRAARWPPP